MWFLSAWIAAPLRPDSLLISPNPHPQFHCHMSPFIMAKARTKKPSQAKSTEDLIPPVRPSEQRSLDLSNAAGSFVPAQHTLDDIPMIPFLTADNTKRSKRRVVSMPVFPSIDSQMLNRSKSQSEGRSKNENQLGTSDVQKKERKSERPKSESAKPSNDGQKYKLETLEQRSLAPLPLPGKDVKSNAGSGSGTSAASGSHTTLDPGTKSDLSLMDKLRLLRSHSAKGGKSKSRSSKSKSKSKLKTKEKRVVSSPAALTPPPPPPKDKKVQPASRRVVTSLARETIAEVDEENEGSPIVEKDLKAEQHSNFAKYIAEQVSNGEQSSNMEQVSTGEQTSSIGEVITMSDLSVRPLQMYQLPALDPISESTKNTSPTDTISNSFLQSYLDISSDNSRRSSTESVSNIYETYLGFVSEESIHSDASSVPSDVHSGALELSSETNSASSVYSEYNEANNEVDSLFEREVKGSDSSPLSVYHTPGERSPISGYQTPISDISIPSVHLVRPPPESLSVPSLHVLPIPTQPGSSIHQALEPGVGQGGPMGPEESKAPQEPQAPQTSQVPQASQVQQERSAPTGPLQAPPLPPRNVFLNRDQPQHEPQHQHQHQRQHQHHQHESELQQQHMEQQTQQDLSELNYQMHAFPSVPGISSDSIPSVPSVNVIPLELHHGPLSVPSLQVLPLQQQQQQQDHHHQMQDVPKQLPPVPAQLFPFPPFQYTEHSQLAHPQHPSPPLPPLPPSQEQLQPPQVAVPMRVKAEQQKAEEDLREVPEVKIDPPSKPAADPQQLPQVNVQKPRISSLQVESKRRVHQQPVKSSSQTQTVEQSKRKSLPTVPGRRVVSEYMGLKEPFGYCLDTGADYQASRFMIPQKEAVRRRLGEEYAPSNRQYSTAYTEYRNKSLPASPSHEEKRYLTKERRQVSKEIPRENKPRAEPIGKPRPRPLSVPVFQIKSFISHKQAAREKDVKRRSVIY